MNDSQVPTTEAGFGQEKVTPEEWKRYNALARVTNLDFPTIEQFLAIEAEARATLREAIEAIEPIGLPDAQLIQRDAVLALLDGVPALAAQNAALVEALKYVFDKIAWLTREDKTAEGTDSLIGYGQYLGTLLSDLSAAAEQYAARLRADAVETALSVERINSALRGHVLTLNAVGIVCGDEYPGCALAALWPGGPGGPGRHYSTEFEGFDAPYCDGEMNGSEWGWIPETLAMHLARALHAALLAAPEAPEPKP